MAQGRLHYLDWGGGGLPAHFYHASGFCAGTYSPFVQFLKDHLHVIASDMRGHGDSTKPDIRRIRNWRIFVDDLRQVIDSVMTVPVIGLGHSLGAVSTYIAAAMYPQLFAGIILIDPVILPRIKLASLAFLRLIGLSGSIPLAKLTRRRRKQFKSKRYALELFATGRGIFKTWSKDFIEAYLECGLLEKDTETAILKCDPEIEAQIYESVPLNIWRYAPRITCPVLALRGQHSDTFAAEMATQLEDKIKDYEWETIPDAGHFLPMEKPETCAARILDFIQRKVKISDQWHLSENQCNRDGQGDNDGI